MHSLLSSNLNTHGFQYETRSQIEHNKLLNSYTPICSFPPEILSLIFKAGQAQELYDSFFIDDSISEDVLPVLAFEILMTHVSSHFREIAIGTHTLWASIHITTTRTVEELAVYMARSDECALSVRIDDSTPIAKAREKINLILPCVDRYHQLTIDTIQESADLPIIRCFSDRDAPNLKHLSISVEDVEEGIVNIGTSSNIFASGAPMLSFVRLRGITMALFNPPLNNVTTLHLDQTSSLPIPYAKFRHMITASPSLKNLSIYGDIISTAWPGTTNQIDLPCLRSLRLCGISGVTYSGLLLGINAPWLESLVLKDVQESDLDQFLASPDVYKFPLLQHLSFHDFEVSSRAYAEIFRAFPAITQFSTTYFNRTPTILYLLAQWNTALPSALIWPKLHTLSFLLDFDDDELIKDVVQTRIISGYPLEKLRVGTGSNLSLLPHYHWFQENVVFEGFQNEEHWPIDDPYFDPGDNLFG